MLKKYQLKKRIKSIFITFDNYIFKTNIIIIIGLAFKHNKQIHAYEKDETLFS
jgi:hypothetical protein